MHQPAFSVYFDLNQALMSCNKPDTQELSISSIDSGVFPIFLSLLKKSFKSKYKSVPSNDFWLDTMLNCSKNHKKIIEKEKQGTWNFEVFGVEVKSMLQFRQFARLSCISTWINATERYKPSTSRVFTILTFICLLFCAVEEMEERSTRLLVVIVLQFFAHSQVVSNGTPSGWLAVDDDLPPQLLTSIPDNSFDVNSPKTVMMMMGEVLLRHWVQLNGVFHPGHGGRGEGLDNHTIDLPPFPLRITTLMVLSTTITI